MPTCSRKAAQPLVLIVTDDLAVQVNMPEWLRRTGLIPITVSETDKAKTMIDTLALTGVVFDLDLGTEKTRPLLTSLQQVGLPLITLSGAGSAPSTLVTLSKPLHLSRVLTAVVDLTRRSSERIEQDQSQDDHEKASQ